MNKRILLAASLLALSVPIGGATAAPRETLRIVLASPTQTLDPQRTPSMLSASLLKSAFEQLTRVSEDGTAQPLLAESWKVEPDGLSWLFRLRPNVRFHDGTIFDAQAVVANLSRVLDSKRPNPIRTNLGPITGAEVVDPQTVRIRTSRPFSGLPIALSHNVASMISPRAIVDGSADSGSRPIAGTGPFKVDSFTLPDEVAFVRNDQYWGAVPKLARIEARSRSDDQTRLASFLSGEADLALYLTPESRRRAEADPNLTLATIPSIRLFILHLPMGLRAH